MSSPVPRTLQPASWYERNVLVADTLIAIVCTLVLGILGGTTFGIEYGPVAQLVPVVMCLIMVIRRTYPLVYVGGTAVIAVLEMLLVPTTSGAPSDILVLVAVHVAARYCPVWFGYSALVLALGGAVWAGIYWVLRGPREFGVEVGLTDFAIAIGGMWLVTVISYALGRSQRAKARAIDAQMAGLDERNRLLQHEADQQLRLATEQERGRLAAETHDILAHSLAIIVAQADGAAMLVQKDPGRAQQAIEQIGETSREALDEIRAKVAALRRGEDPTSELAPAKTLHDLPDLVSNVERAGLQVDLHTEGALDAVPPGISLSAYRIVQEALTNTLKHAGPKAVAHARVAHTGSLLRVDVEDDGRGITTSDGGGNGLRGMQTRVEQYAGSFEAGPRVGGGFAVRATIPLPATPTERTS
ncbi:sensor histidine kinase [Blastococcus sp. Marseille-P5729]|uniref:sensor histidine kinase n=1 Tax=Blastococcus sp. Marseille-P5729 TaxID=2086582 RepID=UPI000D0E7F4E|nr:sensor histidine kinase [Blastococcus sp. Marseille-P5729]